MWAGWHQQQDSPPAANQRAERDGSAAAAEADGTREPGENRERTGVWLLKDRPGTGVGVDVGAWVKEFWIKFLCLMSNDW